MNGEVATANNIEDINHFFQSHGIADAIVENMDCGVFLLSKERKIKAINKAGKLFLKNPETDKLTQQLFGNAIGCKHAESGYECGLNPVCDNCKLYQTIEKIVGETLNDVEKVVDKKIIVRNHKEINKYLRYTFKALSINNEKNVLLLVDDITDLEKHKETLDEKNKQILSSITYAKRIQNALLPTKYQMQTNLKNYFLLYFPRDIIGGDFYWTANINGKVVIALADCTGHGIPGALLTILGISALNEIVITNKNTQPDDILNLLRKQIVNELNKFGGSDTHDGMDMSVCTIDYKNKILRFAGAFNDMIFINNGNLREIKADKMPIGLHNHMDKFTLKEFEFSTGDLFYLFTDGYKDQFGGPSGKKFGKRKFLQLLKKVSNKDISIQRKICIDEYYTWKRNEIQVDDISLLGVKLM